MANWNASTCKSNGIDIHYTRTGGNKPPLILLHGLMTNGLCCWIELARVLEKDYDIIMPDARGHGNSSAPNFGYQYDDHANDIVGLIKALNLTAPILLGHSMGGMTAAVVASRKPDLLRGVILADPTFLTPKVQREVFESDVAEQHRKMLEMPLEGVIADARKRHPTRTDEINELFSRARLQTSMAAFEVLTPPNPDYKMLAGKIDVPCLIVYGDKGVITSAVADELQRENPALQTKQISDAGHSVHRDQPEHFVAVVGSFIRSIVK